MGIDTSLGCTGVVIIDQSEKIVLAKSIETNKENATEFDLLKRYFQITQNIIKIAKENLVDEIAIEGIGAGSKFGRFGNQLKLIELFGVVKFNIFISLKMIPKVVPPATWKKEIIKNGAAKKDQIVTAINCTGISFDKQDLYDAYCLALYLKRSGDKKCLGSIL